MFAGPNDVVEHDSDDEVDNTPMGGRGISSSQPVLVHSEDEAGREEGREDRARSVNPAPDEEDDEDDQPLCF